MKKIHTNDIVVVVAGKFFWSTGKVLSIHEDAVLVEWVNIMKSNKKWPKHHSIHISNIAYFDIKNNKKVFVGIKSDNGKNVRFDKKTWDIL